MHRETFNKSYSIPNNFSHHPHSRNATMKYDCTRNRYNIWKKVDIHLKTFVNFSNFRLNKSFSLHTTHSVQSTPISEPNNNPPGCNKKYKETRKTDTFSPFHMPNYILASTSFITSFRQWHSPRFHMSFIIINTQNAIMQVLHYNFIFNYSLNWGLPSPMVSRHYRWILSPGLL